MSLDDLPSGRRAERPARGRARAPSHAWPDPASGRVPDGAAPHPGRHEFPAVPDPGA